MIVSPFAGVSSQRPVDHESAIVEAEKELGFDLPEDYRRFLKNTNGGKPEVCSFFVEEISQDVALDSLFGLYERDKWADILYKWREYRDDMPEGFLIVAGDPCANFIVLCCEGEDAGIYYWDHKHFFPESSDEQNLYFVAETFTGFVENLKMSRVFEVP